MCADLLRRCEFADRDRAHPLGRIVCDLAIQFRIVLPVVADENPRHLGEFGDQSLQFGPFVRAA